MPRKVVNRKALGQREVACPKCQKRGGVRARFDAYADHVITMNGQLKHVSTAVMDEMQAVECFECGSGLTLAEVYEFNNIKPPQ